MRIKNIKKRVGVVVGLVVMIGLGLWGAIGLQGTRSFIVADSSPVLAEEVATVSVLSDAEMEMLVGGHYRKWQCKWFGGHCGEHNSTPPPPPPPKNNITGYTYQLDITTAGTAFQKAIEANVGAHKNGLLVPERTERSTPTTGSYDMCNRTLCLAHDPTYVMNARGTYWLAYIGRTPVYNLKPNEQRANVDIYLTCQATNCSIHTKQLIKASY